MAWAALHGCLGDGAQITGRPLQSLGPRRSSSRKDPPPNLSRFTNGGSVPSQGCSLCPPQDTSPDESPREGQLVA